LWRQHQEPGPGGIGQTLQQFRSYPLFIAPYTLVGTFRDRLVYFLLEEGPASGYYSLACRFLNAPNSLVSGILRPVVFRAAATFGVTELGPIIVQALQLLVNVALPFWLVFLVFAKPIVVFMFGREWADATIYAQILSFPIVTLLLGNWLDRVFDVAGLQRTVLVLETGFSLAAVSALAFGLHLGGPLGGIVAQAIVVTTYHCVWLAKVLQIVRPVAEATDRIWLDAAIAIVIPGVVCFLLRLGAGERAWPAALAASVLFVLWRSRRQIQYLIIHRKFSPAKS
jgi:O-antigen/teichoic acid export membrane protein